jgi:glycosyltransferase involved in cell wall biosynthesis
MKNILYIGPYKENNGLGRSSRRFVNALIADSNINLSLRPVFFTSKLDTENLIFNEFENNRQPHYDCLIQHGFPEMFIYDSRFGKNIGIAQIETKQLYHSRYIENINLLDKIIVGSLFSAESLLESGVNIETKIIPEPYNIIEFEENYENFFHNKDDNFIFYTIGQYTEKKNLKGIILAFLLEFSIEDNVELFIKTGSHHIPQHSLEEMIKAEIEQIRGVIRRRAHNCAPINILSGHLSDKDMIRLHQSGDCYIDAVRADGNGACAIEALLNNKPVISTKDVGSSSYIDDNNGFLIDSLPTNVFSTDIHNDHTFTIYETWHEPNISSLREQMRNALNNKLLVQTDKELFDHRIISKAIYE